ncbi:hypothetical protein EVAR_20784_1 [Eumeta japonica]|uniref:Uncharacterized protein n=1 Tax=Eumeta variegata TaxID=151549 RepID=A0A4C1UEA2_EUMVA|nr:hypothetical protein EVAR_20784_1 [Eumeta japonica]
MRERRQKNLLAGCLQSATRRLQPGAPGHLRRSVCEIQVCPGTDYSSGLFRCVHIKNRDWDRIEIESGTCIRIDNELGRDRGEVWIGVESEISFRSVCPRKRNKSRSKI